MSTDALQEQSFSENFAATYSPEDNKLRLYSVYRLDPELYARVKAAGFKWAPKQDLFVAPAWSPKREDLLLELCGEIGDEDTSLVVRAEQRAERFEDYSEKRANDAQHEYDAAQEIADNIPFGQPILVGHHSEKKARKVAEKIERGLQNSVKMWETSKYWERRAAGAIRAAKYKERPDVRARRIKKLEAEIRKYKASYTPDPKTKPYEYEGETYVWCGKGRGGSWVKQSRLAGLEAYYSRYIAHNENRLIYERAMLEEQGATDLLKPKPRPTQPPLLNYRAPAGFEIENRYNRGSFKHYEQFEMTKAELKRVPSDYKGTELVNGTHRVRIVQKSFIQGLSGQAWDYCAVFLTDSKVHDKPDE